MTVSQSHPKRRMGDLVVAVCGTLESYAGLRLGQSRRVDSFWRLVFSQTFLGITVAFVFVFLTGVRRFFCLHCLSPSAGCTAGALA